MFRIKFWNTKPIERLNIHSTMMIDGRDLKETIRVNSNVKIMASLNKLKKY